MSKSLEPKITVGMLKKHFSPEYYSITSYDLQNDDLPVETMVVIEIPS